jgi:hypothetical protein
MFMDSVWANKKWYENCVTCHEDVGSSLIIRKDGRFSCHKCAKFSFPDTATLFSRAIQYLNERGRFFASLVLERCSLKYHARPVYRDEFKNWGIEYAVFVILGDSSYDTQNILLNSEHRVTQALNETFSAFAPPNMFVVATGVYETEEGTLARRAWENIIATQIQRWALTDLQQSSVQPEISNQATGTEPVRMWKNFGFRSESEVRIAAALDKINGVMFLPNCKARVGSAINRLNREPDFLVCYMGKWGILEVDGEPSHPPTRTVEDHERDRLFRLSGVQVVEHFDAAECYKNPDRVVEKFLYLLKQSR